MYHFITSTLRGLSLGLTLGATAALAEGAAPLNQTPEGVALDGFDVVAYFTDKAPAKGDPTYAVDYEGATWLFASKDHADLFKADPASYAPKAGGWCSFAVSEGYGAEVDFVNGWAVIDNGLYLNWDKSVRDQFVSEKDQRIPAATANWATVSAGLTDGSVPLYRHADDATVGISHPQALN